MERNFETVMIEQCSPVLAGLKAAGLFRYETQDCKDLAERVRGWNARLGEKGLRVRVLKGCARTHRYLVYVYRENRLREVLSDEDVRTFLVQEGYRLPEGADDCEPLLRLLEGLWRPRCRRAPVCPAEQVHQSISAPVPQRHPDLPPCRGGLKLTFPTNTLFLSWHLPETPRPGGKDPPFDTRPPVAV